MDVQQELTWLQKHERLIVAVLIIVAVLAIGNKFINYKADVAKTNAAVAAQQLTAQTNQNAALAQQVQQSTAQYQAMFTAYTQRNDSVLAAIVSRNTQLSKQQQTNNTLPLPELAGRWKNLAGLDDSEIGATSTGIAVTDIGARKTTNVLEQIPVLTQDKKDLQTVADTRQTLLNKSNELNIDLTKQVNGLNLQIIDQDKSCKAQVADVKAQAKKDEKKWFGRGVIVGFIGGIFAGKHF